MKCIVTLVVLAALAAAPAQALSIKNLSGEAQTLQMEQGGTTQSLHIPANATRYLMGDNIMLTLGRQHSVSAKFDEEYAIWPDGTLMIQRRLKAKGSR